MNRTSVSAGTAVGHCCLGPDTLTSRVWYRAVLCNALISACDVPIIREHFADSIGAAGWPEGACLFLSTRHSRRKRVRQENNGVAEAVFFSPAAIAEVPYLIAVSGAEPSPPPDRAGATLLVGKATDWDLLPRGIH